MRQVRATAVLFATFAAGGPAAVAQLRIAQWNITNWSTSSVSSRGTAFQTAIYGVVPATTGSPPINMIYAGQSMSPDVLIVQEIVQGGPPSAVPWPSADRTTKTNTGQANVNAFLNLLNTAPGSPGDWAAAPYIANQGDSGNALFYRSTRVTLEPGTVTLGVLGTDVCGAGNCGDQTNQSPRDNQRWRVRPFGYTGAAAGADIYIYAGHYKSGMEPADQTRRVPEATRIRADAASLPVGANFVLAGDFNIQSSAQTAYVNMVSAGTGQFLDPINKPGSWNNTCSFRNIHTQEPTPSPTGGTPVNGGMDDRHDQILISATLRDGQGMSYIPYTPGGNILAAFVSPSGCPGTASATAWFDANHSYRCWGNDGNHFNLGILNLVANPSDYNTQVGQTIAQALITSCAGNGHLPVYLDLKVPAKLGAPSGTVDLGTIVQDAPTTYTLQVSNTADVARFSRDGSGWGIDPLTYSLSISPGPFAISGSTGPFERSAIVPVTANAHDITLDTSTTGPKSATLTISSDDPEIPSRVISLVASVVPPAPMTGACCSSGTCTTTTQAACNGLYFGDNVACTPTLCPLPAGACCAADGGCQVATQVGCAGGYQGNGTVCAPNPCPQPGACCNAATGGCSVAIPSACAPHTWLGGACTPNPCPQPTGACCVATVCSITNQAQCSGTFQGPGVPCGPPGNPTTCCPANFDAAGGVSVSDIFAFLTAWFGGDPAADFNGTGGINVTDIFDFLSAWFAGC